MEQLIMAIDEFWCWFGPALFVALVSVLIVALASVLIYIAWRAIKRIAHSAKRIA